MHGERVKHCQTEASSDAMRGSCPSNFREQVLTELTRGLRQIETDGRKEIKTVSSLTWMFKTKK